MVRSQPSWDQDSSDRNVEVDAWSRFSGPANVRAKLIDQLPGVIELVRDQPLRVIAIRYDQDAELARKHLH